MAQVIVTINYREYAISCDNGQEVQIMKLGRLLDEKAKMLTSALGHINENQLLAMVGLLVADELSELKKSMNATVAPVPVVENPKSSISDEEFEKFDEALAENIKSLNETIKSIALQLKTL